jgi:hypothetical protein
MSEENSCGWASCQLGCNNTLFLALGFLKWKKSAEDPKQYRAPLILLPVKLERKSAILSALSEKPTL